MSNTLKEHDLVASPDESLDSPGEKDAWNWEVCLTMELAQDQKVFRTTKGGSVKTYYTLRKDSDDAQSDAGPDMRQVTDKDFWNTTGPALYQAMLQEMRRKRRSAWRTLEECLGALTAIDAERRSGAAERDEQPEIIDEIAEDWTSDRLADELLKLDAKNDWPRLRELILTAEDFDFTPGKSKRLAPRLLDLATRYRDSNDQQDAPVVWSAIRTGASMLRPNEANRLLELLKPGHSIETSLVALKMLGRIFEAQPPEKPDQHADLAGEVRGIANSLLNPYVITSSQNAAMGLLAVYALAAMASNETLHAVRTVHLMGVSWFTQQIARELRELQSSWDARSDPVAPEVLELLELAIHELQPI